jgi:hypothetical protein
LLDAKQAKGIGKSFPRYQMERPTSFLEAAKASEKLAKISILAEVAFVSVRAMSEARSNF